MAISFLPLSTIDCIPDVRCNNGRLYTWKNQTFYNRKERGSIATKCLHIEIIPPPVFLNECMSGLHIVTWIAWFIIPGSIVFFRKRHCPISILSYSVLTLDIYKIHLYTAFFQILLQTMEPRIPCSAPQAVGHTASGIGTKNKPQAFSVMYGQAMKAYERVGLPKKCDPRIFLCILQIYTTSPLNGHQDTMFYS